MSLRHDLDSRFQFFNFWQRVSYIFFDGGQEEDHSFEKER